MAKILDMDKKYQIILLCMIVFFVLIIFCAIFLSFFIGDKSNDNSDVAMVTNNGDLVINYLNGSEINLRSPSQSSYEYVFSVTNTGNNKVYYLINLNSETGNEDVKFKLETDKGEKIYSNNFKYGTNVLLSLKSIEPGQTDRYILTIDNDKNKRNLKGSIEVINQSMSEQTLADLILSNNNLSVTKTNPGVDLATSDEGLIKSEDDLGTSYYFRGNVLNNYLQIDQYIFRIVRINGDDTVRVVLDDDVGITASFNGTVSDVNKNYYLLSNASIQNNLNSWVENNLSEYNKYFSVGKFCAHSNIINQEPTFKCGDSFSSLKVGLLSADEVELAGGIRSSENKEFYLYNSKLNSDSWTSSYYSENNQSTMFVLSGNGALNTNTNLTTELKIRPVLNISIGAKVKGEGIRSNPYVLVN